ncbi:hypothetical protein ACFWVC_08865 [Streptomyces sp. NPDC058691]|uniref:hypothetical protein n=1 Tax=Streptomyces sp. NPDC058691 TaxID=3346601 RepID=UPI0036513DBF
MAGTGPEGGDLAELRARLAALEAREGMTADAAPPTGHPRSGPRPRHPVRAFFSALLIVLACVLVPLSALAVWVNSQIGDTDRYVATVAPLASDRDVQDAAADRITGAVMQHVGVASLLDEVAPADRPRLDTLLSRLAGPLTSGLRSLVHSTAERVVRSEAFRKVWVEANRRIHATVDKALTGQGGGAVRLTNDTVAIDLAPVIDQVKQRLVGAGLTVAGKIPQIHTDFTVVRSEKVGKIRTAFRLLQLVGFWLPILTVVLAAVGVLLAARRRRSLVAAALGFAGAALVLGLALTVFRSLYLDALPASVSQPAAATVYDTLIRFLRGTVRAVIVLGVVVALGAWLSGPGRYAVRVRGVWESVLGAAGDAAEGLGMRTGPVGPWLVRHKVAVAWVVVVAAGLVLAFWSYPTGWVVVGLALAVLLVLAAVEFLARPARPARP